MASKSLEVIEFVQPVENEKVLLLFNISADSVSDRCHRDSGDPADIQNLLWQVFSNYGLLYDVQVKDVANAMDSDTPISYYAFVKYYSAMAAMRAHQDLAGRLTLKGHPIRMRYSNRNKKMADRALYSVKCYDLANYYLGFNGWTTDIVSMTPDKGCVDPSVVRYFCALTLSIPLHGVTTNGVGIGEMPFNPEDLSSKSVARCVARKRSHQHAVEAAFARVILIVLKDGRVYADVNSTIEDSLEQQNLFTTEGVVKVNELEAEPPADQEEEVTSHSHITLGDLDMMNQQILAELDDHY